MPELPEVETVCQGLKPHIIGHGISEVIVRQPSLRWMVPQTLASVIEGEVFRSIQRRGKYLLIATDSGTIIAHLGMSGSFRLCPVEEAYKKHDHVIFILDNQRSLRYHDPRRFGSIHWTTDNPLDHDLLCRLGPEPLEKAFTAQALFMMLQNKNKAVKACLMDHHMLVGVGNIYASEALFKAGVRPNRPAKRVTFEEARLLHLHIRKLLRRAIKLGGTTLRDFVNADAQPGYFQQTLFVYGREKAPCRTCQTILENMRIAQRSSVYCPACQT